MKTLLKNRLALGLAALNGFAFPLMAAQNKPPVANNDSFSITTGGTLNVAAPGVLANDTDADNDPLTAVLVGNVSNGVVTLNPNGSFTYTSAANFSGTDSFTYAANDGKALSGIATVTITVNAPVNHAPVVTLLGPVTSEIPATGSLDVFFDSTDADLDPLTFKASQPPNHGVITFGFVVGITHFVSYTPNVGFVGDDSFSFVANDGKADSNVSTIQVHVLPVLSIFSLSVVEANTETSATFSVLLSPPSTQTVTVNFATRDGTATASSDYKPLSGTITFLPGVQEQLITIAIVGDTLPEADETFFVDLSQPSNALLDSFFNIGTCTIRNDDRPLLSINDVSVIEGNFSAGSVATFAVTLDRPSAQTVTVNWLTRDGTAVASSDYISASGTLTFSPGVQQQTIPVHVVSDRLFEPDETFAVHLIAPINAAISKPDGTCTILNDDRFVGVTEGIPPEALVKVGERLNYGVKWTHPERWRLLDTVDIRIIDDEDSVLNVRFDEAANTFRLFDPAKGKFLHPDTPGSRIHFETSAAVMYLENSQVIGSGPTGPSVLLNLNLSFKPKAAGRVFRVEAFATDDDGNQQGFDEAGIIGVLRK